MSGVSRMQAHEEYRKNGIATKLLDSIRNFFIFGFTIPKEKIAFSLTTNYGAIFALKYLN